MDLPTMEYDEMLKELDGQINALRLYIQQCDEAETPKSTDVAKRRLRATKMAIYCLREYIESWSCPICGYQTKIPDDHEHKRNCPKCLNKHMMPYGYLEQERMSKQLAHLIVCAQHYSTQKNGEFAQNTIQKLASAGRFKPK